MEKKLFDILKERGYVKDLTHEKEIIDLSLDIVEKIISDVSSCPQWISKEIVPS